MTDRDIQIAHATASHIIEILREREPNRTLTARSIINEELLKLELGR